MTVRAVGAAAVVVAATALLGRTSPEAAKLGVRQRDLLLHLIVALLQEAQLLLLRLPPLPLPLVGSVVRMTIVCAAAGNGAVSSSRVGLMLLLLLLCRRRQRRWRCRRRRRHEVLLLARFEVRDFLALALLLRVKHGDWHVAVAVAVEMPLREDRVGGAVADSAALRVVPAAAAAARSGRQLVSRR